MTPFFQRRLLGLGLVALAALACWGLDVSLDLHLRPAAAVSGTSLLVLVLFLTLFNARKKLPFLPLLPAAVWMQIHLYAGCFSLILFAVHVGFRLPGGRLETALAVLFVAVTVSGILGLAISRWLPARIRVHGENLMFERIPALRAALRKEVEELVLGSLPATDSSTIADFYEQKLRGYFEEPRHLGNHVLGYGKPLHGILSEIKSLDRYLNAEERKIMAEIEERVRLKDNLDFQFATQGMLKLWLFVHIPLTYALLILAVLHALVAWRVV